MTTARVALAARVSAALGREGVSACGACPIFRRSTILRRRPHPSENPRSRFSVDTSRRSDTSCSLRPTRSDKESSWFPCSGRLPNIEPESTPWRAHKPAKMIEGARARVDVAYRVPRHAAGSEAARRLAKFRSHCHTMAGGRSDKGPTGTGRTKPPRIRDPTRSGGSVEAVQQQCVVEKVRAVGVVGATSARALALGRS